MKLLSLLLFSNLAWAQIVIPTDANDSDGNKIVRLKQAPSGWSYQVKAFEFETCKLSSVVNKDYLNANIGDVTIKFYDASDVELTTQGDLDTSCTRTQVDWEPTNDYEIIGAMLSVMTSPPSDIRLWVIGVPDIPAGSGGSKIFANGFNLAYLGAQEVLHIDGRASKRLNYNATYHTNKLRLVLRSSAGVKHKFMQVFEIYKP